MPDWSVVDSTRSHEDQLMEVQHVHKADAGSLHIWLRVQSDLGALPDPITLTAADRVLSTHISVSIGGPWSA